MRLAILGSRGFPSTYSGYETLVRHLAPALVAAGDEVTVYGRSPRTPTALVDGVRVVNTPGLSGKTSSTLSHGLTSAWHARQERYDAALLVNVANGYWLPLLHRAGIPTVVNVDGLEWERDKWSRLGKAAFRRGAGLTARWADALVADSRAIGHYWADLFGAATVFIPYGGDVLGNVGTDLVQAHGLTPGHYVLVVARLVPENNVDLVLDAVEALRPELPVVIVGSAVGRSALVERLEPMAARGAVVWLGHVADQDLLQQLWRHCGLYLHGHSVGGTNPSLLQALGAGSPVAVFDTAYNREVVPPQTPTYAGPRELTEIVGTFLADPTSYLHLAEAGRQVVADRYTWPAVCTAYRDLLRRVADRSQKSPAA